MVTGHPFTDKKRRFSLVPVKKEYDLQLQSVSVPFYIWTIGYAYHSTATAVTLLIEKTNDGINWTTFQNLTVSSAAPFTQVETLDIKAVLDSMGFVTTLTYNTQPGTDTLNFYHPDALQYFGITAQNRWRATLKFDGVAQPEALYFFNVVKQVRNAIVTGKFSIESPELYMPVLFTGLDNTGSIKTYTNYGFSGVRGIGSTQAGYTTDNPFLDLSLNFMAQSIAHITLLGNIEADNKMLHQGKLLITPTSSAQAVWDAVIKWAFILEVDRKA